MKKKINLLICVLIIFSVLTGCVAKYENPQETTTQKPTVTEKESTTQKLTETTTLKLIGTTEKKTTTTKKSTTTRPTTNTPQKLEKPEMEASMEIGVKLVALTFDDGPGRYTARLLNILKQNNAHATFFVLGNIAEKNSSLLKRMLEEGNEIGSHSYRHADISKMTYENALADLNKATNAIEKASGKRPSLVRPPFGSVNDTVKYAATMQNQAIALWSVDTRDWESRNADAVYNEIMSTVSDGDIIICHDIYQSTVDAIERAIPDLMAQGYRFVTVSELLTYEKDALTSGEVYRKRY